jgi:hypothetical protein
MQITQGRQLHFENYGLAYRESVIRKANGNPIFYAALVFKIWWTI